jgi:putative tryptophan/tyrosine transport system substrate-binding protein
MSNRREFITLLGGAAAAWPLVARAQQRERVRRVSVLMPFTADDPEGQARLLAFAQGLQQMGWAVGSNLRVDTRWGAGDAERNRKYAAELLALAPHVVVANGPLAVEAFLQATHDLPIVFANVPDPVGQGYVASLPRPGRNVTGFTYAEFGQSAKWLELLKEIAPRVTRAAVLLNRGVAGSMAQFGAIQGVAPSFGVEVSSIDLRDVGEVEHAITAFARAPNGGLILTGTGSGARRELIITLAARHRLPAVYPFPFHVTSGGLTSYGPDVTDNYRLAAGYVDRILKGEKPADLPVQAPTKYRLAINLNAPRAISCSRAARRRKATSSNCRRWRERSARSRRTRRARSTRGRSPTISSRPLPPAAPSLPPRTLPVIAARWSRRSARIIAVSTCWNCRPTRRA